MNVARGQCSAVCLASGVIFAIGGTDDLNVLRSVERSYGGYWEMAHPMNYRRNRPIASAFKDTVIVTGGWNKTGIISDFCDPNHYVKTTEILDTKGGGQWTILATQDEFFPFVSLIPCEDGVLAVGT